MYSVNDIGNICFMGLIFCVVCGLLGMREIWPVVGAMAFVVFVAIMLHK